MVPRMFRMMFTSIAWWVEYQENYECYEWLTNTIIMQNVVLIDYDWRRTGNRIRKDEEGKRTLRRELNFSSLLLACAKLLSPRAIWGCIVFLRRPSSFGTAPAAQRSATQRSAYLRGPEMGFAAFLAAEIGARPNRSCPSSGGPPWKGGSNASICPGEMETQWSRVRRKGQLAGLYIIEEE